MAETTAKTKKGPRRNVGEIIQRGSIWWVRYYDLRGLRRFESSKSTDREEADHENHDVDPVEQLRDAERESCVAGERIDADQAERQAQEQAEEAARD